MAELTRVELLRFMGCVTIEKLPPGVDIIVVSPTEAVQRVLKLLEHGQEVPEWLKKEAYKGVCYIRGVE
jgi:hypothetical protein